jgi:DNA-directed RNA polymerase delta subunit
VAEDEPADEATGRSTRTDALWADVRIDPVEIALPGGVGYTLRAYRPGAEIARPEIDRTANPEIDDFDAASAAVARRRRVTDADVEDQDALSHVDVDAEPDNSEKRPGRGQVKTTDETGDEELAEDEELTEDEELDEDEEPDEDEADQEDVPVFLARNGRVLLFHSPEKLVEFLKSSAEHDLSQLESWPDLVKRVRAEDIEPLNEDRYELDLVVENLRGGSDAWDAALILRAGEVARDLGYALRIESVLVALASGSPLDDLDEALRSADAGGVGSFFARRKLRKIPAQQSSLAWRTVIGKISAVADWQD